MSIKEKICVKLDTVKPYIVFIIGAILYGSIRAFLAETYVLDDTEYLTNFKNVLAAKDNSLIKALIAVLFNADFLAYTGDFRTYGLSRCIHVCILLLFGNNCKVYAFLIGFFHVLSGYFVYKILLLLCKNSNMSFFATLAYVFSPFARVQSFHHFTYLMLPFYILLGYVYWELKQKDSAKNDSNIKKYLIAMGFVILVVFTGEHTLPMLFCVMGLFCLKALLKKNRVEAVRYIVLMVWEVFLFVGWYVFYNTFINKAQTSRFTFGNITVKEGLSDYFLSASNAIKSFLLIPMEYAATVRTHIGKIEFEKSTVFLAIILAIIFIVIVLGILKIVRNNTMRDERVEGILPLTLFCLSSGVIYIALEIFTQSYSQPGRYFYVTLTLFLVLLVVIIFRVFGNKSAMLLAVPIVLACALTNIVWCAVILNQTKESDREIIAFLDKAEEQGYKNVVVYNSGYAWTQALTNITTYAGDSAFDWSVIMDGYVSDNYNFDRLIFTNSDGLVCEEVDEKTVQVFDEKTQEAILLDKDDVCFAGISSISKMWGKYGKAQRDYYYGYQEFSESADCYGVKYYSASTDASMNYDLIRKEELIYIDVGNETEKREGVVLDKPYGEVTDNGICYGYIGEGLVISEIPYDLYASTGDLGEVFLTNRYTGSVMEYCFSNLPEEKQLAVVIDGYEWWQYDDEKRIYDIEIITDNKAYKLENIDTYLLGYVENSKNHKSVYRLMINLPYTTEASVIFSYRDGYDVPTLNAIGIVER